MPTEQITKADRHACHGLCGTGKASAMLGRLSSIVILINTQNLIRYNA